MQLSTRVASTLVPIGIIPLVDTDSVAVNVANSSNLIAPKRFMSGLIRKLLLGSILTLIVNEAIAFTLLGPLATWQTDVLGYNANAPGFGGPMNLGEEYRWNVPVVYYAFTPEFLNYFGQHGVDEVEKAMKFLNDLPPASQLKLEDYPLTSQRSNYRAQALGLVDLKSTALTLMAEGMGICDPTRFVFTLRNRWTVPPMTTNYHVIKRNFDPVTWQNSSFVNGQLWTYTTIIDMSLAITAPVDPLALLGLINAPVTSGSGNALLLVGGFWTGFTRDDVGGLKYIYRPDNYNVENATPNAFAGSFGVSAGGGGSGVPPWSIPAPPPTNTVPGVGVVNTNFINTALRRGLDKVTFQRLNYDHSFGLFQPFTNSWTDTVITPANTLNQSLSRPQLAPDIVFDASDLQDGDDPGIHLFGLIGITFQVWANNQAINGIDNANTTFRGDLGPGVIQPALTAVPAIIYTFNTVGPIFDNRWPSFLSEVNNFGIHVIWGSFDGSTNEPVVYPIGTSIQQAEAQVLGGR